MPFGNNSVAWILLPAWENRRGLSPKAEGEKMMDHENLPGEEAVCARTTAQKPQAYTPTRLIKELSFKADITAVQSKAVLDALIEIAYREASRNCFILPGLCKFELVRRKARRFRNPVTGEQLVLPERDALSVKLSKRAKEETAPHVTPLTPAEYEAYLAKKAAEEEAARKAAEEAARLKAEAEARKAAEAEAARKAAEEASRRAAEEASRRLAEAMAKRMAEAAARRAMEEAARRASEEAAKKAAEEAARRAAEEAAARAAAEEEARRKAEEARRIAEEEARLKAEEEARRAAEEAARRKAAEEAARKAAEEAARKAAEEEAARKAAEEAARKAAEEEAARKKAAEEAAARAAAEEAARKAAEEAARKAAEEEAARKKAAEEAAARKAAEEEAARKKAEEERRAHEGFVEAPQVKGDRAISFKCATCGQEIVAPEETIGYEAECPTCGAILVVPAQSQPGTMYAKDATAAAQKEVISVEQAENLNPSILKNRTIRIDSLTFLDESAEQEKLNRDARMKRAILSTTMRFDLPDEF